MNISKGKFLVIIFLVLSLFYAPSINAGGGGGNSPDVTWDEEPDPIAAGPAPTVNLTASPSTISYGRSSTLTWTSSNAVTCSGTGFAANGATSGNVTVSPGATTVYTITCIGTGGTGVSGSTSTDTAQLIVEFIDIIAEKPALKSGNLSNVGNVVTFKALVDNDGNGDLQQVISTEFEIDLGNDGTYDVTLTSQSLVGLGGDQSSEVESGSWTTVEGTHAIRMLAETENVSDTDEEGCYTVTTIAWTEEIGTEGCSTSGGPNACGLAFDPQSLYATIGYGEITYTVCTSEAFCIDLGIGGEISSLAPLPFWEANSGESCFYTEPSAGSTTTELDTSNNISPKYIFTVTNPQCSDGIDNDGDGDIDYPNDVSCSSGADENEGSPTQCSDGIDNDGNGTIDLSDGACGSAGDNNEFDNPQCSDGIDNDSDGRIDLADRGCSTIRDNNEGDESELNPTVSISTVPPVSIIREGETRTIVWTATDITSCIVSGPSLSESYSSSPVSDQADVIITEASTFTITCDSEGVEVSDSVTIRIAPSFEEI